MSAKIPFSATTNQTENIRWIWSTLFAGGAGVLLQPSRPSENETENGVMDFVSQNDAFVRNHRSISTIWEQRFASLSPNTMDCQDMFVSVADDVPRCWSDIGFVTWRFTSPRILRMTFSCDRSFWSTPSIASSGSIRSLVPSKPMWGSPRFPPIGIVWEYRQWPRKIGSRGSTEPDQMFDHCEIKRVAFSLRKNHKVRYVLGVVRRVTTRNMLGVVKRVTN